MQRMIDRFSGFVLALALVGAAVAGTSNFSSLQVDPTTNDTYSLALHDTSGESKVQVPVAGTSVVLEGTTADAYETTLGLTDPTADRTITLPDAGGAPILSSAGIPDAANSIYGGTGTLVFEGSSADGNEVTLAVTNPGADYTVTIPDMTGSVILSPAGNVDVASAVSGTSGGFVFEGATANGFETTLTSSDVAADATITLPAATGTLARILTGTDPGATCTAGEIFLDTDETVDTNCTTTNDNSLCLCVTANTWTQLNNN